MNKVFHKGNEYDVLHKTTLTQQTIHFAEQHIRYEYLVAHDGKLYLADIIEGAVCCLSSVSAKPARYAKQRMVRDATTDEYIRAFALSRARERKFKLLIDD